MISVSSNGSAPVDPNQKPNLEQSQKMAQQFQSQLGGMMAALQEEEKRIKRREDIKEEQALRKKKPTDTKVQEKENLEINSLADQLANIHAHLQYISIESPELAASLETILDEKLNDLDF